jgi:negative regulator of sigma E activity
MSEMSDSSNPLSQSGQASEPTAEHALKVPEQLSALWDGELAPEQAEFLTKRLERDRALQLTLTRYALIGAALRHMQPLRAVDVTAQVRRGIELPASPETLAAGSTPATTRRSDGPPWLLGWGVAAAVALVGVWYLQPKPSAVTVAANPPSHAANGPRTQPSAVDATRLFAARLQPNAIQPASEPFSYVTPPEPLNPMPQAEMARYVAAHASLSSPMVGQDTLIHLMADGADE